MLSLLWLGFNPWSDMYTKILQANIYDFRSGSVVKNPSANAVNTGSNPGLGRSPGEGIVNPPQYSCLENPMPGWRSLTGHSPWGRRVRHH